MHLFSLLKKLYDHLKVNFRDPNSQADEVDRLIFKGMKKGKVFKSQAFLNSVKRFDVLVCYSVCVQDNTYKIFSLYFDLKYLK